MPPTVAPAGRPSPLRLALTVDFEPDCPPYLSSTFRGIEEGAPRLLELFAATGVRATYFTTGQVAERFPGAVRDLVDAGHELGCHGVTHTAFDTMDEATARWEIRESAARLRAFASVTSFRAPYLRFPEPFVRLLEDERFELDSSLAKYKRSYRAPRLATTLTRIPASMTSSVLRLPAFVRDPWLAALADPVVLFVHPWEFVDLTREKLRYDCRFRTGDVALACLREVIDSFVARGAALVTMRELAA
ncbi:MAG TPA: polysaccharide deacetylase family protein [Gemmatimonadaceae bacterium]|nr:polysaccharide deacetylase family protein [Gemmatimonadaceae bacterium]